MINSVKKSIKRSVSFTDDSAVQSTPKRPRSIFKAKRRSAQMFLKRNPSMTSISELSDIEPLDASFQSNCSFTSTKSTISTKSKRRLSIGEKINKTTRKIMDKLETKSKKTKPIDQHPIRMYSTKLILAANQKQVDDLVIWEEQYSLDM